MSLLISSGEEENEGNNVSYVFVFVSYTTALLPGVKVDRIGGFLFQTFFSPLPHERHRHIKKLTRRPSCIFLFDLLFSWIR